MEKQAELNEKEEMKIECCRSKCFLLIVIFKRMYIAITLNDTTHYTP